MVRRVYMRHMFHSIWHSILRKVSLGIEVDIARFPCPNISCQHETK